MHLIDFQLTTHKTNFKHFFRCRKLKIHCILAMLSYDHSYPNCWAGRRIKAATDREIGHIQYLRSFWNSTQHRVVIPYRRFGTAYLSHLQRVLDFLTLENGTFWKYDFCYEIRVFWMWVAIYQIQIFRDVTRRHIADDLTLSQQHCCERVKSHRVHVSVNPSIQCCTSSTNELTVFWRSQWKQWRPMARTLHN